MKYMLLIYGDDADPAAESAEVAIPQHIAMARMAVERGAYVTCDALQSPETATTVRVRGGSTLTTDGPFVETKEALGGFYIMDCKDLDEAIAYAAMIPTARHGAIEVRPIMEIPGWEEAIGLSASSQSSSR